MTTPNYYDILGVAPSADQEVINAAYQILVRKYHPNAATSPDAARMLALVSQAYSVLSDPLMRADYDERLRTGDLGSYGAPTYAPNAQAASYQTTTPPPYAAGRSQPKKKSSAWLWVVGIIAALIAVVVFAYALLSASGSFNDKNDEVAQIQTAQNAPVDAGQLTQVAPLQPIQTEQPAANAPVATPAQQAERDRAHGSYLAAVNAINTTWNSLPANIKDALRSEQRSINNRREAECLANARSQYSHPTEIETARYLCEVPRLDTRNQQLQAYLQSQASYNTTAEMQTARPDTSASSFNEARASYEEAVANINSIWNNLPNDTREALRDEQRAVNRERESSCRDYAASVGGSEREQRITRYNCETPQLYERAEELSQYF